MSKQTFDQVSAAMWGKNVLDYHTNYIIPRSHWDDSDIRVEALYFAGFAHGLRVGASQKHCQATVRQNRGEEQFIVVGDGKDKKLVSDESGHPRLGEQHGGVDAAVQGTQVGPQSTANYHRAGSAAPSHNFLGNENRPGLQSHTSLGISESAAATVDGPETAESFGILSAPDGTMVSIPLSDSQATQNLPDVSDHPPTSPPQATARKEKTVMLPIIEDYSDDYSDEEYDKVLTLSAREEEEGDSDKGDGDFDEAMERWFDEQGAREF